MTESIFARVMAQRGNWTPEKLMESLHGVTIDKWECPKCGEVYTEDRYPASVCVCGRPLPQRCTVDVPKDDDLDGPCGNVVQPTFDEVTKGWYPGHCQLEHPRSRGEDRVFRAEREKLLRKRIPEHILKHVGHDYVKHAHRSGLEEAGREWLRSGCKGAILAYGEEGSGKTRALARLAVTSVLSGRLRDMIYITEPEFIHAATTQFKDRDAAQRIAECISTPLLFIDDIGGEQNYTQIQSQELKRVVLDRLSANKSLLMAGNRPEDRHQHGPLGWLDRRAASRFAEAGVAVLCHGKDLRA